MRDRAFWVIVALMALLIAALAFWPNQTPRGAPSGQPAITTKPKAAAPVASTPAAVVAPNSATPVAAQPAIPAATMPIEKKPKPEVAIQDGKTIDFSTGIAVVKDDAKQKAAIDKSVKEMENALQNVTFNPPEQKKAEPTPAPPKP